MTRRPTASLFVACALALVSAAAEAKPEAPVAVCEHYLDAPDCQARVVSCSLCHAGPPTLNPYGLAVGQQLWTAPAYNFGGGEGVPDNFAERIVFAVSGVEGEDHDLDGVISGQEIFDGTHPGNPESVWIEPTPIDGPDNPAYSVGSWDAGFAYRRVMRTYCGRSPRFDEVQALKAAVDGRAYVHSALDECLDGAYWKDEALVRLADKRIRPQSVIGRDGRIILGDYGWDYRLWVHALTDDRDARDLLLAQYHVDEGGEVVEGRVKKDSPLPVGTHPDGEVFIRLGTGQPLEPERRAGMITTQWFIGSNTMFTEMPRTTASQAYRAYLGMDIAKGEGIHPIAGEPLDVDHKGVTQTACAACHSTLDPLAYSFSDYVGFDGISGSLIGQYSAIGSFDPDRTPWDDTRGALLGQPVTSVREWAEVAASSSEFRRNLAELFFRHAIGEPPRTDDMEQFHLLWMALPQDGYSANRLLHRLVDTDAFGTP